MNCPKCSRVYSLIKVASIEKHNRPRVTVVYCTGCHQRFEMKEVPDPRVTDSPMMRGLA